MINEKTASNGRTYLQNVETNREENQILSIAKEQVYLEEVSLQPEKTAAIQLEELAKEH